MFGEWSGCNVHTNRKKISAMWLNWAKAKGDVKSFRASEKLRSTYAVLQRSDYTK